MGDAHTCERFVKFCENNFLERTTSSGTNDSESSSGIGDDIGSLETEVPQECACVSLFCLLFPLGLMFIGEAVNFMHTNVLQNVDKVVESDCLWGTGPTLQSSSLMCH